MFQRSIYFTKGLKKGYIEETEDILTKVVFAGIMGGDKGEIQTH